MVDRHERGEGCSQLSVRIIATTAPICDAFIVIDTVVGISNVIFADPIAALLVSLDVIFQEMLLPSLSMGIAPIHVFVVDLAIVVLVFISVGSVFVTPAFVLAPVSNLHLVGRMGDSSGSRDAVSTTRHRDDPIPHFRYRYGQWHILVCMTMEARRALVRSSASRRVVVRRSIE